MIVSRTPLRISFAGGGSDINWFYRQNKGVVVSSAINKYIYITVNKKFDNKIRASYSSTEIAHKASQLKHELIRECLNFLKIDGGIEITSISDIPSEGTGLGSSSSYTVGLLHALHAFKGEFVSAQKLAEEACAVEIDVLKKPIGKQDQYIAAFGGLQYIQFNPDESVFVDPIICDNKTKRKLNENLLMFYTGLTRSADNILKNQKSAVLKSDAKFEKMKQMTFLADDVREAFSKNNLRRFGAILDESWSLKRQLSDGISNKDIDSWYKVAKAKGALGGKITGAGGGGFLVLYAPKSKHADITSSVPLNPTTFKLEPEGSKIIFVSE